MPNIVGGTVVAVAFCVVLIVVIMTVCHRRSQEQTIQVAHSTSEWNSFNEELGLSKQIMGMEHFKALGYTSHNKTIHDKTFEHTYDSPYNRTWDGTPIKAFNGRSARDRTFDRKFDQCSRCDRRRLFALEPESDLSSDTQSDLDEQSVSSFRTWLLGSVDLLDVISEEQGESRTHADLSDTNSSRSNNNVGGDAADVDFDLESGDNSLPLFHSCSDEATPGVLDTAFSDSTTPDYETCSESTTANYHTCSEHSRTGSPRDQGQISVEGRIKDESECSGTSAEVSSGCFDLSYVTFHTLPTSECEDSTLQPVYDCFDPSVREESGKSEHILSKSLRSASQSS